MLRDRAWAEESVYDTLLRVWRSPGAYRAERGSLRAFLLVAVRNDALDQLRGETRRIAAEESAHHLEPVEGDVQLVDAFEAVRVRDAIADLDEEQRDVILRVYYKNRTAEQIAEDTRDSRSKRSNALAFGLCGTGFGPLGRLPRVSPGRLGQPSRAGTARFRRARRARTPSELSRLPALWSVSPKQTSARLAAVFPARRTLDGVVATLERPAQRCRAHACCPPNPRHGSVRRRRWARAPHGRRVWARERRRSARLETRAYVAALAIVALLARPRVRDPSRAAIG